MKKYDSSMKLDFGVKIFVVGKAGLNDAMMSSSLWYQSCDTSYIYVCFFADVAYRSSLGPLLTAEAALGWSTRSVGPQTSPGDRMETGCPPPPCRDWSSKDKGALICHTGKIENTAHWRPPPDTARLCMCGQNSWMNCWIWQFKQHLSFCF